MRPCGSQSGCYPGSPTSCGPRPATPICGSYSQPGRDRCDRRGDGYLCRSTPTLAHVDPLNPCTCDDDPEDCTYHYTVGLLLHEGAHVSEGSTKKPDEEFYRRFTGRGTSLARVAGLTRYFEDFDWSTHDFTSALEVVHEYNWMAPGLANAFEDARINTAVGDKRSALGQQMRRIVDDFISEFATGTGFSRTPAAYQVGAGVEIGIEHGLNLTPMVHSDAARGCLSDPVVKSICEVDMDCTAHACAAAVILAEYARLKYGLFDQSPDNESGTGRQTETGRDTDGDGSMRPTQRNREVGELASDEARRVKQANRAAEADEMGTKEYLKRHGWRTGRKPQVRRRGHRQGSGGPPTLRRGGRQP